MKPIEINLATRPFRNNTLYWTGFGSAALALAVVSAVNVWLFLGYGSTVRQHREDFTSKQQRREALARDEQRLSQKLTRLDFKGLSQQSEFANDAIRRRTFSWTELFNRLEEVVPPAVMMVAIRPEIQAEGISIVAEGTAKDQEGLLSFEENLIKNSRFARIYPGSERREQRGQDLRFSLKFDYVPGGRPDASTAPAPEQAGSAPRKPPASAKPKASPAVAGGEQAPAGPSTATKVPAASPGKAAPSPAATALSPPAPAAQPSVPAVSPSPAPASATPAGGQAASQSTAAPPSPPTAPRGGGPRPLMKPGGGGRPLGRGGSLPVMGPMARKKAEEAAAARFAARPIQDVFDYLMKYRSMTFVFGGDFDLRQKVTMDLSDKEEEEILQILSLNLDCMVTREGAHAYRLSPKSGGEPLEEPPVEEEPAPQEEGPSDPGQEDPS